MAPRDSSGTKQVPPPPAASRQLTLGPADLAGLLHCSLSTIYKALHDPGRVRLPPRVIVPGSRRLLWLTDDVVEWLRRHRELGLDPAPDVTARPATRRRGRPSKGHAGSRGVI